MPNENNAAIQLADVREAAAKKYQQKKLQETIAALQKLFDAAAVVDTQLFKHFKSKSALGDLKLSQPVETTESIIKQIETLISAYDSLPLEAKDETTRVAREKLISLVGNLRSLLDNFSFDLNDLWSEKYVQEGILLSPVWTFKEALRKKITALQQTPAVPAENSGDSSVTEKTITPASGSNSTTSLVVPVLPQVVTDYLAMLARLSAQITEHHARVTTQPKSKGKAKADEESAKEESLSDAVKQKMQEFLASPDLGILTAETTTFSVTKELPPRYEILKELSSLLDTSHTLSEVDFSNFATRIVKEQQAIDFLSSCAVTETNPVPLPTVVSERIFPQLSYFEWYEVFSYLPFREVLIASPISKLIEKILSSYLKADPQRVNFFLNIALKKNQPDLGPLRDILRKNPQVEKIKSLLSTSAGAQWIVEWMNNIFLNKDYSSGFGRAIFTSVDFLNEIGCVEYWGAQEDDFSQMAFALTTRDIKKIDWGKMEFILLKFRDKAVLPGVAKSLLRSSEYYEQSLQKVIKSIELGTPADYHNRTIYLNLQGINFFGKKLIFFSCYANLHGAILEKAEISISFRGNAEINLNYANLKMANFTEDCWLPEHAVTFNHANLAGANLSKVSLRGIDFTGFNLAGVNFNGTKFRRVIFTSANLTNTTFREAHLVEVNLNGAILVGANFTSAALNMVDLTNADLQGGNLTGVMLIEDPIWVGSKGLSNPNLLKVREGQEIAIIEKANTLEELNKFPIFRDENTKTDKIFVIRHLEIFVQDKCPAMQENVIKLGKALRDKNMPVEFCKAVCESTKILVATSPISVAALQEYQVKIEEARKKLPLAERVLMPGRRFFNHVSPFEAALKAVIEAAKATQNLPAKEPAPVEGNPGMSGV